MKASQSGMAISSFSIAANRTWTNKQGQKQQDAQFHHCVAFGKQAEGIPQYCTKGSLLLIDGRLQTRSWDGPDGQKNYRTEVVLENFQFGQKRDGAGQSISEEHAPIECLEDAIDPNEIPF